MRSSLHRAITLIAICALTAAAMHIHPQPAVAEPQFTIEGGGWGHGIGLSQYGARGYARDGWNAEKILAHYYQGTKLVTMPTVKVKVNLDAENGSRARWWIKAGGTTALTLKLNADPAQLIKLDATNSYWVVTEDGKTLVCENKRTVDSKTGAVRNAPGAVIKTFDGECYATAGGFVQMVGTSGPYSHSGVIWRGTIHFRPTSATSSTSRAINYVDLEHYLYGVVPREMPSGWETAALQAQAVAARSYAYQDAKDGKVIHCTVYSQVYNGFKGPKGGEVASTNAAVDKTKGRVVWYGSETKPVKTYFSSSSGGHTANVEDVWLGSTPKPYYKGVVDNDEYANSYFTWTEGPFSAGELADKIRAKDRGTSGTDPLDYSVAAPATIADVTLDRSAAGFTRYVNLTWSNGAKFKIRGETFRSAFGLKSTKFTVSSGQTPEPPKPYSDTNSKLAWTGLWKSVDSTSHRGGSMHLSTTKGSLVTAGFDGTGVRWVSAVGPSYGKAKVYIDGKLDATIDLYSSKPAGRRIVYTKRGLTNARHRITVKVAGEKNTASSGVGVGVDGFEIYDGTMYQRTAELKRFESTSSKNARLGTWTTVKSSRYSGGSVVRTSQKNARFYATFYGSEVRWIGTAANTYGKARVSINGGKAETITITSTKDLYRQVLYKRTGLPNDRAHTIMIEVVGPTSGGTQGLVAVDAVDVRGGWLLPATIPARTVEQTDRSVSWTGIWKTSTSSKFSGSSHKWASAAGANAKLRFEGTHVAWIGKRGPKYGKARVYLDGVAVATVDEYGSATSYKQVLWQSGRLPAKKHTLEIRVLGAKRSAALGRLVGIDAFRVWGRPIR